MNGHDQRDQVNRLAGASAFNVAFAVVQVVVGLAIGSVVVLADAAHQGVDALGLVTALLAVRLARRSADERFTYGLGKSDALGGLVSAMLLLASVIWIVRESIDRLVHPQPVDGWGVVVIGMIAIAVNAASVWLVGNDHGHDHISMRAARLHLLTDLAGSFIVVASGLLLAAGGPEWIDPVASLLLSAAVLVSTWRIIVAAAHVLLDRAPGRLSTGAVEATLLSDPDVDEVHHVHLRPVGRGDVSATAHVVIDGDRSVHDAQDIVTRLAGLLASDLHVEHATIQVECHDCDDVEHPSAS